MFCPKRDYEADYERLIADYPPEYNTEVYSIYKSMEALLEKEFKYSKSTVHNFIHDYIEPRLDIKLYRRYVEMSPMTTYKYDFKKSEDKPRYCRIMHFNNVLGPELTYKIYCEHGDINGNIVNKYRKQLKEKKNEENNLSIITNKAQERRTKICDIEFH